MNKLKFLVPIFIIVLIIFIIINTSYSNTNQINIIAYGDIGNQTEVLEIQKYKDDINNRVVLYPKIILKGKDEPDNINFNIEKDENLIFIAKRTKKTSGKDDNVRISIKKNNNDITNKLFLTKDFQTNFFANDKRRDNIVKSGTMAWIGKYMLL